jgi:hypothetical protein
MVIKSTILPRTSRAVPLLSVKFSMLDYFLLSVYPTRGVGRIWVGERGRVEGGGGWMDG